MRQPQTARILPFMPKKDMPDILAPEDHKQGTLLKDRPAGHHHGNKAKKMEVAQACYQERPRQHNTDCIKVDTVQWKKEERTSTRNLEEDDRSRNENNREDMERTCEDSHGQGEMEISGLSLMCHQGAKRIILCQVLFRKRILETLACALEKKLQLFCHSGPGCSKEG